MHRRADALGGRGEEEIGADRSAGMEVEQQDKLFLIQGRCPVVLSGIEQAKAPFLENRQLSQRAEPAIELKPLAALKREDRLLFAEFLKAYVGEAEAASGLTNIVRLLDASTAAAIHEVSGGVLGAACNLIKAAVTEAMAANRRHLTQDDLASAINRYVIAMGLHDRNPFHRSGEGGARAA